MWPSGEWITDLYVIYVLEVWLAANVSLIVAEVQAELHRQYPIEIQSRRKKADALKIMLHKTVLHVEGDCLVPISCNKVKSIV